MPWRINMTTGLSGIQWCENIPWCRNRAGASGSSLVWSASRGAEGCGIKLFAKVYSWSYRRLRRKPPYWGAPPPTKKPGHAVKVFGFPARVCCPSTSPTVCLYTPGHSTRLWNTSWLARHVFQLFRALWLKSRSPRRIRPAAAGGPLQSQSEGKKCPKWRQLERRHQQTPSAQ